MHNNNYNQQAETPMNYQYPEHLHTHVNDIYNRSLGLLKKRVRIITVDQNEYKGILDHVDNKHVYLLFDHDREEESNSQESDSRYGYGYGGYGVGPGYGAGVGYGAVPGYGAGVGYGGGFGAGLGGAILPLAALTAISAL
ncbi:hypothetical protein [Virgibacillus sp. DJP39]|uniref:hypothetical protein n=1 Tax=Virgibacillus sp. DJP39 TaxID=3409790 RepID=UPI003BB73963